MKECGCGRYFSDARAFCLDAFAVVVGALRVSAGAMMGWCGEEAQRWVV
jgi:hypothetical protein